MKQSDKGARMRMTSGINETLFDISYNDKTHNGTLMTKRHTSYRQQSLTHKSKIKTYFLADKQVFWFDVSVDDVLQMAIVQCDGQVVDVSVNAMGREPIDSISWTTCYKELNVPSSEAFRESCLCLQHFVQLSTRCELKNNINTRLVPEISKHAQNVLLTG